jgi:hypothetical protein
LAVLLPMAMPPMLDRSLPIRTSVRPGIGCVPPMPSWLFSEPTPLRSIGVPLKLLSLKPTSRSLTSVVPMMRFQLAPTLQNGFSDSDANESGMTVASGVFSCACFE